MKCRFRHSGGEGVGRTHS